MQGDFSLTHQSSTIAVPYWWQVGWRMNKKRLAGVVLMCAVGAANASLVGRDIKGNAVASGSASEIFLYDTVLNVTWLRDAYARTPTTWASANAWVGSLNVGGYTGWRLPTMIANPIDTWAYSGTDKGYNVRTTSGGIVYSEMASLWYATLGNKSYYTAAGTYPQTGWGRVHVGDFQNFQDYGYWSGLKYAATPSYAWLFDVTFGGQTVDDQQSSHYVLAVRPGDVLTQSVPVSAVPIPATAWLMLSGIGVLGAAARRRQTLNAGSKKAAP
jgi:hypothetical protein